MKGKRGNPAVYASTIAKTGEQGDGSEEERKTPLMKGYSVFNVEQIEGLPEPYYTGPAIDPAFRIGPAEEFFAHTGADIRHGANSAHHSGGTDRAQMPAFGTFRSPWAYYARLAHEPTHNAELWIMPCRSSQLLAR